MPDALTSDQEWALRQEYGSIDNAIDEAIRRSLELEAMWQDWWPRTPRFWEAFWARALPVLGVKPASQMPASGRDTSGSEPGSDLAGGKPYSKSDYVAAGKLHARNKLTIQGIEKHASLKRTRAYRVYRQFKAGVVLFDDVGLRPGPGYRWDTLELEKDPPRYKLIPY